MQWYSTYGKIEVKEQTFYQRQGGTLRPFCLTSGVSHRSYSLLLQRAVTDFGGDHAFGRVNRKLKEHDGIELPISAARTLTLSHAQAMAKEETRELGHIHKLDYKTAIEKGLPIGSGEIESAHRYVIQERLKIQGAWW